MDETPEDKADEADEDEEFEYVQPEQVILFTSDTAAFIPCVVTLSESLGGEVLAYQLTPHGLFWLTPQRRWENVEKTTPKLKATK